MKSLILSTPPMLIAAALALAACGRADEANETDTMEGGGAYASPEASPTDTLSTDPAAAATQNEAQNMAPSSLNSAAPPQGQPTDPASPAPPPSAP